MKAEVLSVGCIEAFGMADDPAGVFDEGIIGQRGITLVAPHSSRSP